MTTSWGTCYFATQRVASSYYGYAEAQKALKSGRIKLGRPKLKVDERLFLDTDGRYHIVDSK